MKRSLFSLLGVKTGGGGGGKGGGKMESFMDILSRGKDAGWSSITASVRKVSVSGWSVSGRVGAGGQRNSA